MTQNRLKELVHYEPETGIFTHLVSRGGNKESEEAGHINKINGYLELTLDGKKYKGHRMAFLYMNGNIPEQIDHKNQIRSDNKWSNMKTSDAQSNMMNKTKYKSNTTGHSGVYLHKESGKFQARIQIKGTRYTSLHETIEEAVEARKAFKETHGFSINHS